MKIGYVTADITEFKDSNGACVPGGAGWYRCYLPGQALKNVGHDFVLGEYVAPTTEGFVVKDVLGEEHDDCQIIVFQRWMYEDAPKFIRQARAAGQIVINDIDDWFWGLDPQNKAFYFSSKKFDKSNNREHYKSVLAASSMITTSTPYLAERLGNLGTPIAVLRNAIDLDRWEYSDPIGHPLFGWVGSTSHRSGDLETLKGVVGPLVERHDTWFHHSGFNETTTPACHLLGVPSERSTYSGMASIIDYPSLFSGFNIGIVPLRETPFNFAKSAIKGMEYAAAGIPFVAQATPEYRWLREEMGIGFSASKPIYWKKFLEALTDEDFRVDMARENRENLQSLNIAEKYTEWEDVYSSLL